MKIEKTVLLRGAAIISTAAIVLSFNSVIVSAQTMTPTPVASTSSSADLQASLGSAFLEHVDLSIDTMRAGYDGFGSPKFQALAGTLDQNSVSLANSVSSVYGQNAGSQFLELWRKHIDYLNEYSLATKNGDQNMRKQSVDNLDQAAPQMARFLNKLNPNLPTDTVTQEIKNHEQDMITSFDDYAKGDYSSSYSKELMMADSHATAFAEMVVNAIVRQSPNQFP